MKIDEKGGHELNTDTNNTRQRVRSIGIVLLATVVLTGLSLAGGAAGEGAPTITFNSPGGHASGGYVLNVSITGDVNTSAVYYGVDEADPTTELTQADGEYFEATIDTTALDDGEHTISVKALNTTGEPATATLDIIVDNHSPVVGAISAHAHMSGDLLFKATAETLLTIAADPKRLGARLGIDDFEQAEDNLMTFVDDHFEFTVDTTQYDDGSLLVRIWAFDMWGNNNRSRAVGLDLDNTLPDVDIISSGGNVSGEYTLTATVTDEHLNESCVKARVGGADPVAMELNGTEWKVVIDTFLLASGEVTVTVMACDTWGNTNDTETVILNVLNGPDLMIVNVAIDDFDVEAGDKVKVDVTVKNVGNVQAEAFDIALVSGGNTLVSVTENGTLDAGAERTYTIEWKTEDTGDFDVSVAIDPTDKVTETDETNNTMDAEKAVKVNEESPGMGAALMALAMLSAVLVLRRRR